MCVCPQGYKLHSCDIEPVQQFVQDFLCFKNVMKQFYPWMKHTVKETKIMAMLYKFHCRGHFNGCTIVTRRSVSVIKVGVAYGY